MDAVQLLGFGAGMLTVASYVPQVVRTWRTRETDDLALGMFVLLVTADVLWIVFGFASKQWPVIVTNVALLLLAIALLVAKLKFPGERKRRGR